MIRTSGKLTPAAFTAITASPAPGIGDGTSSTISDSGGPYALQRTAFTRRSLPRNHESTEKSWFRVFVFSWLRSRFSCSDRDALPRDVSRVLAAEERGQIGDVLGGRHPPQ